MRAIPRRAVHEVLRATASSTVSSARWRRRCPIRSPPMVRAVDFTELRGLGREEAFRVFRVHHGYLGRDVTARWSGRRATHGVQPGKRAR